MDPKTLIEQGDNLFSKRGNFLLMLQDIAEQFYPERADFTVTRTLGDTFAEYLSTSYPLLVRRDLGNSFGSMMRPNTIEWFHMRALQEEQEDQPAMRWLEWATGTMRRAMYDRSSLFTRASKEADHDIAAFGQAVKTVELNRSANGLLYRCWHLRDTVWCENEEGKVDTVHRKWKPTVAQLCKMFVAKGPGHYGVHSKVAEKMVGANKSPYAEIHCRHIVVPSEMFDGEYAGKKGPGRNPPFISIYLDVENKHIMEAVGQTYFMYVIPRWQTVPGSQYAYSPATVAALPDARLLQAMTYTLLEAGEKATNPPMVAVMEAIRSDVSIYAGGITAVDAEYDERLGEVLRPIAQDKNGLPLGFNMRDGLMVALSEAFFLNKLSIPANRPQMTAYEVSQWVQDFIRQTTPLFEPLEHEDNGAMCETTFELMLQRGAFGAYEDIPQSIRGQEIGFRFESPLHDAIERQKGNTFAEALGLTTQTIAVDPTAIAHVDFAVAFRDTLSSVGVPAKWIRSEKDAAAMIEANKEQEEVAQVVEDVQAGATAAQAVGLADQALGPEALAA